MNIEPLGCILEIYNNKNKVFQEYLDKKTVKQLNNYIYFDDKNEDLYLNDNVAFVKKNTGKFYKKGKIISISENIITIKVSTYNFNVNKNENYIFIKEKKHKNNNREFYKALLNQL
tara:strand:+ start:197 stop:544 length:348 start_codon:yes stop_codon:yes gene_type:complete